MVASPILRQSILLSTQRSQKLLSTVLSGAAASALNRFQTLLDLSTFDCNKPIVVQMFQDMCPDALPWRRVDTNSHRKLQIIFERGCFVKLWSQHDGHNYGSNSYAIVVAFNERRDHTNQQHTNMMALRQDGTMGNRLTVYNPFDSFVLPCQDEEQLDKFLAALPDTLETRSLLQGITE